MSQEARWSIVLLKTHFSIVASTGDKYEIRVGIESARVECDFNALAGLKDYVGVILILELYPDISTAGVLSSNKAKAYACLEGGLLDHTE